MGNHQPVRLMVGFLFALPALLLVGGFLYAPISNLPAGLWAIVSADGLLLTDYLALGGVAPTLVNAGLCGIAGAGVVLLSGAKITGAFIAAVYTVTGFAFFGKNVLNIWPILLGTFVYARVMKLPFRSSVLVGLFGTTLAPLVSFFWFSAGLPLGWDIVTGVAVGVLVGIVLPPLASHMLRFHDGFSIYNIGFTGGIVGSFFVALFRSFDFAINPGMLLVDYADRFFEVVFGLFSVGLVVFGLIAARGNLAGLGQAYRRVLRSTGRLVSDFVQIGSLPAAAVNMGVMGCISIAFVLLLGGHFNGPVIGGVLTVVGFGAFGKHPRNCLPILAGVAFASLVKIWDVGTTVVIIAGLFGTTLAPIAGQFGTVAGIAAGFFHLSVVMNVGVLHGGVNLYNNGFAGGFVAAVLVPLFQAFAPKRSARVAARGATGTPAVPSTRVTAPAPTAADNGSQRVEGTRR